MSMAICPRPCSMLSKGPTLLKRTLTEKNKFAGLIFSDFITYFNPMISKSMGYVECYRNPA